VARARRAAQTGSLWDTVCGVPTSGASIAFRVAFAALWVGTQGTLVLTADDRADHSFGFRMFPEATTLEIRLGREVSGGIVPAPGGEWSAGDGHGHSRRFSWHERVRDPVLGSLDRRVFASYGADAQLARLQRALDDVADHVPDDHDTVRLRAEVLVWRNGREATAVTLVSHQRTP
jgi:hypothetical protein